MSNCNFLDMVVNVGGPVNMIGSSSFILNFLFLFPQSELNSILPLHFICLFLNYASGIIMFLAYLTRQLE